MNEVSPPIAGYWYSDGIGHLIQVRAITYHDGVQAIVTTEDINGTRCHISPKTWQGLKLIIHSPAERYA